MKANEKKGKIKASAFFHLLGVYSKYNQDKRPLDLAAARRTKARRNAWEDVLQTRDDWRAEMNWTAAEDEDVDKCVKTQLWRHRQWDWLNRGTYVRFHTPLGIDDCNLWEDGYRPATGKLDPDYEKADPDYNTDFECDAMVEENWEK